MYYNQNYQTQQLVEVMTAMMMMAMGVGMVTPVMLQRVKIPTSLKPLAKEARKYDNFDEFSSDYSIDLIRGRYWHITDNPNFSIRKVAPRDLSSMAMGGTTPGLMVSYTPEVWRVYFPDRKYAAEIDLSRAYKNKDFTIVNRGFGHEIFIHNLDKVSVIKIIPIQRAIREGDRYNRIIPQSKEALRDFWESVEG